MDGFPSEVRVGAVAIYLTPGPVLTQRTEIQQRKPPPLAFHKVMTTPVEVGVGRMLSVCQLEGRFDDTNVNQTDGWRQLCLQVLVLSLRAGGQGLNLQAASYVVHFDRWWNPAVEDQASDRAHRAGQLNPVTVYAYVCADTIEERIETILADKRELFRVLVDGVSLDPARAFSAEDLFGLLGLPAPARLRAGQATAAPRRSRRARA